MPQGDPTFPPNEPPTKPDVRRSERYREEHERFLAASLHSPPKRRGRVVAVVVLIFVLAMIVWTLGVLLIRTAAP